MTTRKRARREHREHDALRREMRQLRRELIHLLAVLVPEPEPIKNLVVGPAFMSQDLVHWFEDNTA